MAEQSKFAGALGRLNKPPVVPAPEQEEQVEQKPRAPQIPRPASLEPPRKVRPAGKRSDPEFSPTTFFVRKETKRKAAQLLLNDTNAGKDLSDLVEELLAKWVIKHSNA